MRSRRHLLAAAGVIGISFGLTFLFFGSGAHAASNYSGYSGATGNTGATSTNAGPVSTGGPLGGTAGTPYNDTALTPSQQSGKTLFEQVCSSCHGVSAEGSARAPTLVGLGAATVDFWVRTGRMPLEKPSAQAIEKPPLFTPDKSRQIADYVAAIAPGGEPIPTVDLSSASLQNGGELFRLNCATCHSFVGAGGALSYGSYAPTLATAAKTPVVIAEAIRTGPANMPRFSTAQLSDSDMNDIIRYVTYAVQPQDRGGFDLGHVGPVAEGFIGIGLGVGLLMVAAFWIGERAA